MPASGRHEQQPRTGHRAEHARPDAQSLVVVLAEIIQAAEADESPPMRGLDR